MRGLQCQQLLVTCKIIYVCRMEKYSPDILRVLSQIEKEITKVEEELKCLEDKGALHEINEHMRRSQNVLYQAQMVIAEKLSSVVAEQCES